MTTIHGKQLSVMVGATSSVAGVRGVVPAPAAGDEAKFLRGDATWQTVSGGANSIPIELQPFADDTGVYVVTGGARFIVPYGMNGMNLVKVEVKCITTGGTSGATEVRVYNQTDSVSMLTVNATMSYNENYAADATIDTSHDDVATGDIIRVDVIAIPSGGTPLGLYAMLTFETP